MKMGKGEKPETGYRAALQTLFVPRGTAANGSDSREKDKTNLSAIIPNRQTELVLFRLI